jgi:hypothetical protein
MTDKVFTHGDAPTVMNNSAGEYIAYCWHSVPGYSSIGSYTGNGSTDGTFVYTGFKPAYVLIKRLTSESWIIADSARNPYNPISNYLIADGSGQEGSGINYEFLSNGIKFRAASQNETDSYIYMAFAEKPETPASRVTIPKPDLKVNDMRSMYFDGSSYLSRTSNSSSTDQNKYTISMWIKKMNTASNETYLSAGTGTTTNYGTYFGTGFHVPNSISVTALYNNTTPWFMSSAGVQLDISSWYHYVVVMDQNNATLSERVKIYVNGVLDPLTVGGFPDPTHPSEINDPNTLHNIGRRSGLSDTYFNGYLANVQFIDGQALEPLAFAESVDDVWIPKQYEGAYGTNGFHLDFAPENMEYSGDTITRVLDESPNSNHWDAH